jgi:sodium/potassium-transporting ATPase subunit alpha
LWIGGILIGVAFINAFVEFYQVQKAQNILESFLNLIPSKCYAIRDKTLSQISALELVIGDVVYIRSGDKIPADCLLFQTNELKVDNSSLTGEADPQERVPMNQYKNPLEATNLAFNGTLAVNGEGYGIVIRTGDNTVIGQIASLTANEEKRDSPLSNEINHFVHVISYVAAVTTLVFVIIGIFLRKQTSNAALNFAIGNYFSFFISKGLLLDLFLKVYLPRSLYCFLLQLNVWQEEMYWSRIYKRLKLLEQSHYWPLTRLEH